MSLINQMLQELDARGTNAAPAGIMQGQVRVVPERTDIRMVIWALAVLLVASLGAGIWWWQSKAAVVQPRQENRQEAKQESKAEPRQVIQAGEFSLKMSPELNLVPLPDVKTMSSNQAAIGDGSGQDMPAVQQANQSAAVLPQDLPKKETPAIKAVSSVAVTASSAMTVASAASAPEKGANPPGPEVRKAAAVESRSNEAVTPAAVLNKQFKELTPQQKAENAYRNGATFIQQGRTQDAFGAFEQALQLDPYHVGARQALVALLIENKRKDEAIKRLREGLQLDASQTGFAMILARLQVDRGETGAAIDTLQKSLPGDRPDHSAFLAALLQRESRHREAIEQYRAALARSPQNGVWWMGMGISLQAENRLPEAIDAFSHARLSGNLSPELRAFVEEKLTGLQR